MRLHAALLVALLCALVPAAAQAKEVTAAQLCGADGCQRVRGERTLQRLVEGGTPVDAPDGRHPFYVLRVAVDVEQEEPMRFETVVLPEQGLMQGEDGTWMPLSAAAQRALVRLTRDRTPNPAAGMPAGRQLETPQARVVGRYTVPAAVRSEGGSSFPWGLVLAGAAAFLAVGGLLAARVRLRRRPRTA